MPAHKSRPTLGGLCLQHVIVFLICVAFPGGVTMMAPATWLTFERIGEAVHCTSRTCAFFVVPFRTERVAQVTSIGSRERAGKTERKREFGRTTDKMVNVDGEGFLQINGEGEERIEVSVSPVSLKSVQEKAEAFLNSSDKKSTTLFAIANWKFGGLMGGVLSLFTLLYVVGYTLGFLQWTFTVLKKTFTR